MFFWEVQYEYNLPRRVVAELCSDRPPPYFFMNSKRTSSNMFQLECHRQEYGQYEFGNVTTLFAYEGNKCNMLQQVRVHKATPQRLYQTRASEARLVKQDLTLKKTKCIKFFSAKYV